MKLVWLLLIPIYSFSQSWDIDQYKNFITTKPLYKKIIINSDSEEWTATTHKITTFLNPGCFQVRETIYDSVKTNIVTTKVYICDSLAETETSIYFPTEIITYDSQMNVLSKSIYNPQNKSWTTSEDRSYGKFSFVHIKDSLGRVDEDYKNGELLIKRIYYGNPQDSCLQFNSTNKLIYKTIWKYNKFNNVEYMEDYSYQGNKPDIHITTYSYVYDKHNNWIEKKEVTHHYPAIPLDEKLNPPVKTRVYKRKLKY